MSPTNNQTKKPTKAVSPTNTNKNNPRRWYRMPKRVELLVLDEVAKGRTCVSLAKELKCSPMTIHFKIKESGHTVASLRKAYANKPKAPIVDIKTGEAKHPHLVPMHDIKVSTKTKSSLRMLAFYLGVSETDVLDAAVTKYHQLQQSIAREMIAKGTPWQSPS
jgi:hypothetical protein